jgi:hypothetical protein
MTVFVAGGSGTIGRPLVRALVAAGLRVVATTRSPAKQEQIARLGATPVVVDALDAAALERAVGAASPTHVIHQLTALPSAGPRSEAQLEETNPLREDGTRNLLKAAEAAGARRIVVASFAPLAASVSLALGYDGITRAARAVLSMEDQVLTAARRGAIEVIVLRYGLFYGAGRRQPMKYHPGPSSAPAHTAQRSGAIAVHLPERCCGGYSRSLGTRQVGEHLRYRRRPTHELQRDGPRDGSACRRPAALRDPAVAVPGWRSRTWSAYSRWIWRSRMPPHAGICNGQRGFRATRRAAGDDRRGLQR